MSQKNGHALESVTLTAMLRRWTSSLLLIAVTAASALSAMILQNLTIRQENALSSTIENTTISCTVTNAKGTDSGNLQMLSAFVEMLEGKRRLRECYLDDYVKTCGQKRKCHWRNQKVQHSAGSSRSIPIPLFLRQKVSMSDFLKAGRKKICVGKNKYV